MARAALHNRVGVGGVFLSLLLDTPVPFERARARARVRAIGIAAEQRRGINNPEFPRRGRADN